MQVVADDSGSWDKEQWSDFHAEALPLLQEEHIITSLVHCSLARLPDLPTRCEDTLI